jgi:hypothetical protein
MEKEIDTQHRKPAQEADAHQATTGALGDLSVHD